MPMPVCDARTAPVTYGSPDHVGRLLDQLHARHGWYQRDVAVRLGVNLRTVRKWKAEGAGYVVTWALEVMCHDS